MSVIFLWYQYWLLFSFAYINFILVNDLLFALISYQLYSYHLYLCQLHFYKLHQRQSLINCNYISYLSINHKVNKDIEIKLDTFDFQIYITSYIISRLKDICNFSIFRNISKSRLYILLQILIQLEDICNLISPKDILHLLI